jgi:hypothetical protein
LGNDAKCVTAATDDGRLHGFIGEFIAEQPFDSGAIRDALPGGLESS